MTDFQYDSTSNRQTGSTGGMTKTYTYDAAGNIIGDGSTTFGYDARGRLAQVTKGSVTQYAIDRLGQRVAKTTTSAGGMGGANTVSAVYFVYDGAGHLLGEYDGAGAFLQETVWLEDLPIGVLKASGQYSVNPDHLGPPLTVTDVTGQIVWRWDRDPYGNDKPNENPSGVGTFTYNLRFPGQYYDKETELHYNYFRDYNPKTGRYVQADPVGLNGTGVNLYTYVGNNPVVRTDQAGFTWASNTSFLWDFMTGGGRNDRFYLSDIIETREMMSSPVAEVLRNRFYSGRAQGLSYTTVQATIDTLLNPEYWSSTALQVGGFAGASAVDNCNGTVTYTIRNTAGANSFFYHLVKDSSRTSGPFRNINQTFVWTENVRSGNGGGVL